MPVTLTRDEALAIQRAQVDHYAALYGGWVRDAVARATRADLLPDGELDVVEVNRRVPRGGAIEALIERIGHRTQLSDR